MFILNLLMISISSIMAISLDYTKANKNIKYYEQVPQNELIFSKLQAAEPTMVFEGTLKGRGHLEPFANQLILNLRKKGILTYVNYFTPAKSIFYHETPKYEVCTIRSRERLILKKIIENSKANNDKRSNRINVYSIPFNIGSKLYDLAIQTKKLPTIEKYKFSNTNVYNIKSILDDPNLKTIQIIGMGSNLRQYIYNNPEKSDIIKFQYKYRVYEFVASNSIQIPLMLRGNRMDWADISGFGDYYFQYLKIPPEQITFIKFAHIHPKNFNEDNLKLWFIHCSGDSLTKMQKVIKNINESIKVLRTNRHFWTNVLKQYAIDFEIPYVAPEDFFMYKETFNKDYQLKLGNGYFDLY